MSNKSRMSTACFEALSIINFSLQLFVYIFVRIPETDECKIPSARETFSPSGCFCSINVECVSSISSTPLPVSYFHRLRLDKKNNSSYVIRDIIMTCLRGGKTKGKLSLIDQSIDQWYICQVVARCSRSLNELQNKSWTNYNNPRQSYIWIRTRATKV